MRVLVVPLAAVLLMISLITAAACGGDGNTVAGPSLAPIPSASPNLMAAQTAVFSRIETATRAPSTPPAPAPQPAATPAPTRPPMTPLAAALVGAPAIALTIDVDTIRGYTAQILDTLQAYGVHASFGVTGKWAVANPDLLTRMVAAGHTIMNHSWNHPSFNSIDTAARQDQLVRTENAIQQIAGISTKPYFRPPYGAANASVRADVAAIGYSTILWNIDPRGWKGYSGETISDHILSHAFNGGVVLMHTNDYGDSEALRTVVGALADRGYRIVTIAQLYPAPGSPAPTPSPAATGTATPTPSAQPSPSPSPTEPGTPAPTATATPAPTATASVAPAQPGAGQVIRFGRSPGR